MFKTTLCKVIITLISRVIYRVEFLYPPRKGLSDIGISSLNNTEYERPAA